MSNLQRRGGYTPRRAREQRAFRMVVVGGGSGALAVISVVLAAVGVIGWFLPVLLIIIAALCAFGFMRATGQR
jgi:hypothetical protein